MTESEFARGWKFLILQPWGARYRAVDATGQPTEEAKVQMAYYFGQLQWAHPEAWVHVVREMYARGDHWPSVQALFESLRLVNTRFVRAIDKPRPLGVTMQEALQERPDLVERLKRMGVTG